MHVRNQGITIEGEFTYDSMRLELLIDLDDLLRDRGVVRSGEWDANGTFHGLLFKGLAAGDVKQSDLTFCANGCGT